MSQKAKQTEFPRGSEWRRWDLQVHTPLSALNNGFGQDFDAYAKILFERAVAEEIAVIGVTDYFTIDGYKRLRSLQQDSKRLTDLLGAELAASSRRIRLLANVEFRLNDLVRVGERDSRINAHVIFSDDVDPRDMEENFLHRLLFVSESEPANRDAAKPLTVANLAEFGARLKAEHATFASRTDLEVGMSQATVSHGQISDVLSLNKAFKRRYLFVAVADEDLSRISWDGQGHSTRKVLIQKSHMLFSASPGTRAFALGQKAGSVASFEAEFRGRKPCIHGSDAHSADGLFVFAEGRRLWVRADPTFDGLVQLCHEPEDRVYIGTEPPALQRIRASATKSIEAISFQRDAAAGPDAEWFSGSVPLNAGMVAVIGKKGSGKSALADVIGLLGEAQTTEDFSFLTPDRFLNPRSDLGRRFEATLRWRSGDSETRKLDASCDPSLPERVRHIPQNYLEKICAEIQESSTPTLFDRELEGVIFSHVPRADRLGYTSLEELFRHTTEETEAGIQLLRKKLAQLNREYVELRRAGSPEARRRLDAELAQRRAELEAHRRAKPAAVKDPSKQDVADPQAEQVGKDLAKAVAEIEKLDERTKGLREKEELAKRRLVALDRVIARIGNLETTVKEFYEQSAQDAALLELDPNELVTVQTEVAKLEERHSQLSQEIASLGGALDVEREGSDAHKRRQESARADALRKKLAEPQRRHQEYLHALARWEAQEAEIIGSEKEPKSVKGLESKVAGFEILPDRAAAKRQERDQLVREIFAAKSKLLDSYRDLYRPVQAFAAEHPVAEEASELSFDAVIAIQGLEDAILDVIDQRRRGSFQGDHDGRERLRALIKKHDFSSADGVADFLQDIGEHLARDVRIDSSPTMEVADQLMRSATVEELYDFLFGLEYLKPRFKLLWRGKPLDQLSPGERGTLLLIFYLLIDREDMPLVIDQPEENLDNETIAELLVPAVKHAKQLRQIILVTHNPNLAVVCDADQVIHASIDKANGNRVTYTTGAIEDPTITQLIVDVLEGTKPAFDLRDAKYEVLDRVGDQEG
jgi:predicted ATPase